MKIISISANDPVLIAGPTASGKSALALKIAQAQGGQIINADALQVFQGWRILTARPSPEEEKAAPHALYGHVPVEQPYSVGDWLADLKPLLHGARPIITGGTGLYFEALTQGLADIPPTPPEIRSAADQLTLSDLIAELDAVTAARLDLNNRMRVQRAWEVQKATGHPLSYWHRRSRQPLLPLEGAVPIQLDAPKDWLTPRIEQRFDRMLETGLIEEAQRMAQTWSPDHPGSKAIGAAEMIDHLEGRLTLQEARERIVIATRQYAKRQRTWFKKRMATWHRISLPSANLTEVLHFQK